MTEKVVFNNLLISIGFGNHPSVRLLHAMVREKSNCKILILTPLKKMVSIDENLRENYSLKIENFQNTFELIRQFISEGDFKLIGISFMSNFWDFFVNICKLIRQELPDCKIIAGGVHAWHISPMETLKYSDFVCAAEGEELYSELVDAQMSDRMDSTPLLIPGLIEKHNGEIIHTPKKVEYLSLNELPLPTYGGDEIYNIVSVDDRPVLTRQDPMCESTSAYIHIGRGCPFKCTFCINSVIEEPKIRFRKVDRVIEEIQLIQKIANIMRVFFWDEVFPLMKEWLAEFSEKYSRLIGLPFQIGLFPGNLNEDKIAILKAAGLKEISMGLQSGSEKIRKNVYARSGKNEMVLKENTLLVNQGIVAYYDIIIKNPFESEYDYQETLELVRRLRRPFYLKFYTLAFFPRHPITERALAEKLISPDETRATISYLDVITPHRFVLASHFISESGLLIWNKRMIEKARSGSIEHLYYLMMSYYGYWFIPEIVLKIIYNQFVRKKHGIIICFAYIINGILLLRNNFIVRNLLLLFNRICEKGFSRTMKQVLSKFRNRFIK